MTYELHHLAAGSYDLVHDGVVMGSVVRSVSRYGEPRGWHAELLEDLPPERRPHPFSKIEHRFTSLEAVTSWLGGAVVVTVTEAA
ncbi:hypothetical protein ASF22_05045 [Methylobacterium sp. Leaf87]|uniref:hypothetical protein n=1 Tax=Methylobacterium sp. Leaf87 TaxID=1736243 RepID=UPI0006F5129B|nr:hypothetical protein [Methylobacterium sp. Leaf87]KQO66037.1 hypothetical protein ASF22_05045 [Methylobacterium sp. Leaf87]